MNALHELASQWERQAQRLDELNAAVPGGTASATIRAAILRENAAELLDTLKAPPVPQRDYAAELSEEINMFLDQHALNGSEELFQEIIRKGLSQPDVLSLLDSEAAELVNCCFRHGWSHYRVEDVVSGCVRFALVQALYDVENTMMRPLSCKPGEQFSDDAWGYVEESVFDSQQLRLGYPDAAVRDDVALAAHASIDGDGDESDVQEPPDIAA